MSTALASVVTNTYTSGFSDSQKPSVDDNIGLFSPTDTPFMANMSKEKAVQVYEEWLEDDLAAAAENLIRHAAKANSTIQRFRVEIGVDRSNHQPQGVAP